jgi:hypothetical protein
MAPVCVTQGIGGAILQVQCAEVQSPLPGTKDGYCWVILPSEEHCVPRPMHITPGMPVVQISCIVSLLEAPEGLADGMAELMLYDVAAMVMLGGEALFKVESAR